MTRSAVRWLSAAVTAAMIAGIGEAVLSASTYPDRAITMVVPFNAGGVTDVLARILTEPMKTSLGQPVIIENVPGASGAIGVGKVARAVPDGYTLSIGDRTSHVVAPALVTVQYDALRDLEPVAPLTTSPLWIVAKAALSVNSLKELIAWLQKNPDQGLAATAGIGSAGHLSAIEFQRRTGTRFQFVPYRSGSPAVQALFAGQVDFSILEASQTLPYVQSGQIKALAVMSKDRWTAAPDVPTTDEAGAPGLCFSLWRGLWAPKGVSKDVLERLNAAVADAFANQLVQKRIADLGQEIPQSTTPEALRSLHEAEIAKWWPIVRAADLKAR